MLLRPQYFSPEPVIIAGLVVFVIDLVGNTISFSNRFLNALATAVVFSLIFGALVNLGYGNIAMTVSTTPSATPLLSVIAGPPSAAFLWLIYR